MLVRAFLSTKARSVSRLGIDDIRSELNGSIVDPTGSDLLPLKKSIFNHGFVFNHVLISELA